MLAKKKKKKKNHVVGEDAADLSVVYLGKR